MIGEEDLSRGVVNTRVNRIKPIFKWAVSEAVAPPSAYEGLRAVAGLRCGRTDAKETDPVKPVPWAWVEPVRVTGCARQASTRSSSTAD